MNLVGGRRMLLTCWWLTVGGFHNGLAIEADEWPQMKNCTNHFVFECPPNSLCVKLNDIYQCLCNHNFVLNTQWNGTQAPTNRTIAQQDYCLSKGDAVQPKGEGQKNKLIVYIRSPAKTEHLAFGILLVLLAAILAIGVLYVIKILRPLKRTKNAYTELRRRQQKHQRLEEFDDDHDIVMMTPINTNANAKNPFLNKETSSPANFTG